MYYLYRITDALNNKVYIGQSNKENERWRQHKWFARQGEPIQYVHRAMKKYGVEHFIYEVIAMCLTQEATDETEMLLITRYDSRNKERGYNIAPGGEHAWNAGLPKEQQPMYGKKQSEYHKQRMKEVHTGKLAPHTDEWKQQHSNLLTGHVTSEETKHKISIAQRGDKRSNAVLSWEIVRGMRKDYSDGMRQCDIAIKYNVSTSRVNRIIKQQQWIEYQ